MSKFAIEVNNLQKKFKGQSVLDGISLAVEKGKICALLGPNGAGKTTFINILSTLIAPDAGTVRVAGYDIVRNKEEVKSSISLTGQFAAVDEMLTAEENLRMMARLSGLARKESHLRANELIERFDLTQAARKKAGTFSGGMRRRLDLASSLVIHRPVLFLDEPTTGLDTRSRRTLWDMILNLKREGVTVLLTTQYLEEADELADTIAMISNGHIVAQGTPSEMKSRIGSEVVELRNETDEVIQEIPTNGCIHEVKQILEEVTSKFPASTRISIRRPSLDDVFLSLTSEKGRVS